MKRYIIATCTLLVVGLAFAQAPRTVVELLEETDSYRRIAHAAGVTEVPLNPQRIVSLDWQIVDNLLAMGLPIVGGVVYGAPYLVPFEGSFVPFGFQPNIEAILGLAPDLILGADVSGGLAGLELEQLTQIAPTVVLTNHPETFRRNWPLDIGLVVGETQVAEAQLAELEAFIAVARETLQAAIGDETVAVLNIRAREFRLYGDEGHTAFLYDGLDLTPARLVRELTLGRQFEIISQELIPELADADHLFLFIFDDADEAFTDLQQTDIWRGLRAVQRGNVYPVVQGNWLATSLLADRQKVEDVLEALTGSRVP
jgi:iron complex transport system substrate-binding protein